MRKRNSSKHAFFSSIISLILCVTMLIGTTMAWFTDTVTNTGNRILAGDLGIDLLMDKPDAQGNYDGKYESIGGSTGDIFSEAAGNGILWEPGKTEIVYLEVKNTKNLAAKYNFELDITDDGLSGALEYAILDGAKAADVADAKNWTNIEKYSGVQIADIPSVDTIVTSNGKLLAGESDYFALAVHMKENAGNEYKNKSITIDVTVLATQVPEEEDSFGTEYDAAAIYPAKDMPILDLGSEWINVLTNSSFDNGTAGWEAVLGGEAGRGVGTENGNNYYITKSSGAETAYSQTRVGGLTAGETYKITARVKRISGGGAEINMCSRTTTVSGNTVNYAFVPVTNAELGGDWVEFEYDYTVAEGCTAIILSLHSKGHADGTVVYWDDVQVLKKVENAESHILAESFKAMLAEEKENLPIVEDPSEENEDLTVWAEPFPGQTNLVKDSGFENGTFTADNESGWALQERFSEYVSIDTSGENAHSGNNSLHITVPEGTIVNAFAEQFIDVVSGAQYQISFWYKAVPTANTQVNAVIKAEYYADHTLPGAGTSLDRNVGPHGEFKADGEWHQGYLRINTPDSASEVKAHVRALQGGSAAVDLYFDDISVYRTGAPDAMTFAADEIFYYTGDSDAQFKATAQTEYYPELENGTVDFQVYNGKSVIWESKDVAISNGTAVIDFKLENLMRMATPYYVMATMYDADGNEVDVKGQKIYVYDRPDGFGADGVYYVNGEAFYPVMGYHAYPTSLGKEGWLDTYNKVAEAGINLVQMGQFYSVDDALMALDAAEEAGIMGAIALYYATNNKMQPAGHEDNMEKVIMLLSDERITNHPALFGYMVQDEPYNNNTDMKDMENSYRLIRMFDTVHPTICCIANSNKNAEGVKYVDILLNDPYCLAEQETVTYVIERASKLLAGKKPVYAIMQAFYDRSKETWCTPEDGRNNIYQALLSGANGIGFLSMSDAYTTATVSQPLWDNEKDNGALWNALVDFAENEKDIVFDHFLGKNSEMFNKGIEEDQYRYYSWTADGGIYMVVLGLKNDQSIEVEIPLTSTDGSTSIGEYTATVIGGEETDTAGNGTLKLTVDGVEAILYKITPTK